jgi:predicted DCC family thiol-disulfide oxidoreductase YuxK
MEARVKPILLFNDQCGVCRRIARWVGRSERHMPVPPSIVVRAIGEDPEALKVLNPNLDIWDAYATIHMLMPDGSMKRGGEAVGEVLRNLRSTKWFARSFTVSLLGVRPFQIILNAAYAILADVRPLFGCESCGTRGFGVRPIALTIEWATSLFGAKRHRRAHFTSLKSPRTDSEYRRRVSWPE